MRITVTIDDDMLDTARELAAKLGTPFRTVVNEALRAGLKAVAQPPDSKPHRTRPHRLALRSGRNLDSVQDLLAQVEGEDAR